MTRFAEIVKVIHESLHLVKPLLFELVLFLWAAMEMGKFIWTVAMGSEH